MNSTARTTTVADAMDTVAQQLGASRRSGRRPVLYLPGNAGRVVGVEQWIFDHPQRLRDVDVFQVLALGPAAGWEKAVLGGVGIVTPFIGPGVRQLVNAGLARNIRCNLSQVPRLFEDRWRPDVAIAHTSMPDEHGRVTLGLNAGIDFAPVSQARFKVAMINPQMPRWHIQSCFDPASGRRMLTGCAMSLDDFDLVIEIDEAPIEHSMSNGPEAGSETEQIAGRIVELLCGEGGATPGRQLPHVIQLGIGKLPNAVANALVNAGVSVKGVWSELFSDGVLRLYEAGLIRRGEGPHLRDRIVVGFVLGSRELYRRMHDNPDFAVLPQEIVNDPALIKHNDHMTSINSAIAISLTGEVSAATIQRHYYSDVGGQFDFALGASWAHDGIAIIALPSVARLRDGSLESKIVALHPEGAHHTIGADLPVVVVTEHGAADLRNLNDTERVEAMLGVVHPDWRDVLAKEARALPSMQGVGAMPAHLIALKDGRHAVVRPAGKGDIGAISEYIERLSSDDRRTRYMGTISLGALTSAQRLARLYHDSLDYLLHAAFIVDLEGEIIGVVHAFRLEDSNDYEISFSRRSDLHGQGIGSHLMQMLIEWGLSVEAQAFHAVTYRSKNPRMRALFDSFGFVAGPNPEDPHDHETVAYTARLEALALVSGHPMND